MQQARIPAIDNTGAFTTPAVLNRLDERYSGNARLADHTSLEGVSTVVQPGVETTSDTGARNIASLVITANGWDAANGSVVLQRVGKVCHLALTNVSRTASASGYQTILFLPVGYTPINALYLRTFQDKVVALYTSRALAVSSPGAGGEYLTITWVTNDPMPNPLPGVAA